MNCDTLIWRFVNVEKPKTKTQWTDCLNCDHVSHNENTNIKNSCWSHPFRIWYLSPFWYWCDSSDRHCDGFLCIYTFEQWKNKSMSVTSLLSLGENINENCESSNQLMIDRVTWNSVTTTFQCCWHPWNRLWSIKSRLKRWNREPWSNPMNDWRQPFVKSPKKPCIWTNDDHKTKIHRFVCDLTKNFFIHYGCHRDEKSKTRHQRLTFTRDWNFFWTHLSNESMTITRKSRQSKTKRHIEHVDDHTCSYWWKTNRSYCTPTNTKILWTMWSKTSKKIDITVNIGWRQRFCHTNNSNDNSSIQIEHLSFRSTHSNVCWKHVF